MFAKGIIESLAGGLWQYLLIALAVATAGLGVAYVLRGAQLTDARADVKSLEVDLRQAKVTIAGYADAVKQCNAATKALEQASAEKQAATDDALARARKESQRYQESNKRLAVLVAAPSPPGATCATALGAIRRELRK